MSAIETSKPTPGPWFVDGSGASAIVRGGDMTIVAVRHRLDKHTHEANAHIIAEAGTVYHETGKTPRQLADEVERLTAQVESLTAEVEEESHIQGRMAQLLAGAIVAIRGPEPELTRWGYHDLPERVRDVVTQRDALLAAAKLFVVYADTGVSDDDDTAMMIAYANAENALRAAIHQCEGARA